AALTAPLRRGAVRQVSDDPAHPGVEDEPVDPPRILDAVGLAAVRPAAPRQGLLGQAQGEAILVDDLRLDPADLVALDQAPLGMDLGHPGPIGIARHAGRADPGSVLHEGRATGTHDTLSPSMTLPPSPAAARRDSMSAASMNPLISSRRR